MDVLFYLGEKGNVITHYQGKVAFADRYSEQKAESGYVYRVENAVLNAKGNVYHLRLKDKRPLIVFADSELSVIRPDDIPLSVPAPAPFYLTPQALYQVNRLEYRQRNLNMVGMLPVSTEGTLEKIVGVQRWNPAREAYDVISNAGTVYPLLIVSSYRSVGEPGDEIECLLIPKHIAFKETVQAFPIRVVTKAQVRVLELEQAWYGMPCEELIKQCIHQFPQTEPYIHCKRGYEDDQRLFFYIGFDMVPNDFASASEEKKCALFAHLDEQATELREYRKIHPIIEIPDAYSGFGGGALAREEGLWDD